MCGNSCHGGDDGDSGGSATRDDNVFAGVIEVVRPVLRMNEAAAVIRQAGVVGLVSGVVTIVAGASVEKIAGEVDGRGVFSGLDVEMPERIVRRPRSGEHAMMKANAAVNAELVCGFAKVLQDGGAVGDGVRGGPWAERVTEGVHVGVGADAGVAEEVPGAADRAASFEDNVGLAGTLRLQAIAGSDAGEAGSDDDNVEVLVGHGGSKSVSRFPFQVSGCAQIHNWQPIAAGNWAARDH